MHILDTARDWLDALIGFTWTRSVLLLFLSTAVTYLPARRLSGKLRARRMDRDGERREDRILRDLVELSLWPTLSIILLTIILQGLLHFSSEDPQSYFHVVPILGFFLLYRFLRQLMREFIPASETRRRLRRGVVPFIFLLLVLQQLNLLQPMLGWLRYPLFHLGGVELSAFSFLSAILFIVIFHLVGKMVAVLLGNRILPHVGMDSGTSEATGTVLRYILVVVGYVVALETIGFDLTTIKIAFGALGVGIGFGLQNIVNNFISGLILLFERTVKRGDVITAAGTDGASTDGRVMDIGLRSSIIRTRTGDDIIMPNSQLVSHQVTNYSHRDRLKRVDVDIGVSYGSDPHHVREVLMEVARNHTRCLKNPPPSVLMRGFGESEIVMQMRVWIDDAWRLPRVKSELLFGVWDSFKQEDIEIPFPQRDLHLRTGWPAPELKEMELAEGEDSP